MKIWIITLNLWEVTIWNYKVTRFLSAYFGADVGKLWHMGRVWPAVWCLFFHQLRMVSAFLNGWRKKWKTNITWHVKITWNSNVSVHKSSLEHSYTHLFTYCLWVLWVVATKILRLAKPEIFTVWSSAENVCQPLLYRWKIWNSLEIVELKSLIEMGTLCFGFG